MDGGMLSVAGGFDDRKGRKRLSLGGTAEDQTVAELWFFSWAVFLPSTAVIYVHGTSAQTESRALISHDRLVLPRGSLLRIVFRVLNVLPMIVLGCDRVGNIRLR